MKVSLERLIRRRARNRCEYCHLPAAISLRPFQIDHIIARQHEGPTNSGNLAFCCPFCNAYKGPNIAGIDPETHRAVGLFNPRRDIWADHFVLRSNGVISGLTRVGRTTVSVLNMNNIDMVELRNELILEGIMKPETDQ
jgi:hypothetical protein